MPLNAFQKYVLRIQIVNDYITLVCESPFYSKMIENISESHQPNFFLKVGKELIKGINEVSMRIKNSDEEIKPQWVTLKNASQILGVSMATTRRLIDRGVIKSKRTTGGRRRVEKESLYTYWSGKEKENESRKNY